MDESVIFEFLKNGHSLQPLVGDRCRRSFSAKLPTWSYIPRQSRSSNADLLMSLFSSSALLASVGAVSHRFHLNPPPPASEKRKRNGDCDADDDGDADDAETAAAIAARAARR